MLIVGSGSVAASMAIVNGSLCVDNDGWCTASTTNSTGGEISAIHYTTGATDLAENYLSSDEHLVPGEIVAAAGSVSIARATMGDGSTVIGIVSTKPGITLGLDHDVGVTGPVYPIALAGRVPLLVNLDNGPIATGDRIALSTTTPGVGMKARPFDSTVGIALLPYTATSVNNTILAFVHLQQGFEVAELGGALLATSTEPGGYDFVGNLFSSLKERLSQWFADATNGITKFFAGEVHTNKLCVEDADGAQTCITKAQLDTLLGASPTFSQSTSAPTTPDTPSKIDSPTQSTSNAPTTDSSSDSTTDTQPVDTSTPPADTNTSPATSDIPTDTADTSPALTTETPAL
jgi:hypothetical protein